jgi:hypothetical protein
MGRIGTNGRSNTMFDYQIVRVERKKKLESIEELRNVKREFAKNKTKKSKNTTINVQPEKSTNSITSKK